MPTLHWIGKDKVINHHMDVPFKVLEHAYGFDNGTQTNTETKGENEIINDNNCLLTRNFMTRHHLIFKKIPRDITRF